MEAENSEDLRMVWITEAFSSMTGYTSKEIEERGYWKWDKIVHPEDRSSLKAHLGFILDGKIDSSSFRIITKNGMIRWFQDLARPAKDETTGKTLIIGATKDITDMVQAEIAAERLLNFNESLLNSAGEGIIGLDNKGFIAFINPVASSLLAKKEIELLGEDHISAFYHTDKEGKKRTPENSPIMDSLKSGKVVNITEDIFWRNDNIPIHIEYISSPIISDKTVTGSVLIFKDISVRLEAERKIKEAREIAEQANKSKSEFLANMSHELRTPLNSIIGFSKLMKFSKTEEEKLEFSEYIHTSGTHLLRLINELLDYSKIEAGKMQFDRKPVNLSKIAEESITLVFLQAQQKEIKIHFNQGNCNDYCVIGDEKRLKQVVINLLSNAVKFTEKKGSINVDINLGENQISLSVKDTGIGMNQEDIGVIFEKFSQLSSGLARNSEGTGLGLAISKKIIEYHSGKISVDSSPGKGSIFTITLPCFNKANISSSLDSFTNLTSYPESLKTKTILLLDPDQTARSVLEAFFLTNDQKFFSAVSGNEALEIYGSRKIDAIIAEVDLMNSDGIPFAHMIRENNHKIPIIAVTSKQFSISEQEILTKLKKEGYDQFLTKPVDLEIFLNNLKELISLNRL
ncbi:MAG: ATP-binding protein, partial [Spirochaetia bacterium]|nr:ATP-binding protein [Spirochaetia bacterium]